MLKTVTDRNFKVFPVMEPRLLYYGMKDFCSLMMIVIAVLTEGADKRKERHPVWGKVIL